MTETGPAEDAVEEYLDRLLVELRGRGRDVRRILAEVEGHLHDAMEAAMAEGLSVEDAERRALARFGSPAAVARRFARRPGRLPPAPVLREVAFVLVLLSGIRLVAIGASGGLAAGMGAAFGKDFVSGDANGVTYTPARCATFLEYHPSTTCEQAAVAHHFDEIVFYRLAAGVLGLAVLAGCAVLRRSRRFGDLSHGVRLLPDAFAATVGAAVFGAASVVLVAQSLGQILGGDSAGAGNWLSGGLVSLVVAGLCVVGLHRALLSRVTVDARARLETSPRR
jgi:hypothetical protein